MPSTCDKTTKNYDIFSFCILTLLTLLGYSNTLFNDFACDDIVHIVSNVKVITNFPVYSFLFEPISPGNLYRPLVQISYAITHRLFGLNASIFHLTNIIVYLLSCFLVYKLFLIITSKRISLISASIFSLLPIHSEVIANISGRYELFSTFFSLSTLLIFFKEKKSHNFLEYLFLSLIYLLALLSKENAVTILGVIIIFNIFLKKEFDYLFIKKYSAILTSLFIYLLLRKISLQNEFISSSSTLFVDNPLSQLDIFSRIINATYLLGKYFSLVILPFQLSADYSFNQLPSINAGIPSLELFVAFCVIIIIILTSYIFLRERKIYSLSIIWFFTTFSLTSNIIFPIGTIFGERLAYLPSVGLCLLLGELISKQSKTIFIASITAFFSYYLFILIPRNYEWKNDITLNNSQIYISPQSAKTQDNYGLILLSQGKPRQALEHFNNALKILPTYLPAKVSLAQTYEKLGDVSKANEIYHAIFSVDPYNKKALMGFIRLNLTLGNTDIAQEYIKIVIKFHGEDFDVLIQEFTLFILKDEKLLANNLRNFLVKNFPKSQVVKDLIAEGINRGVLK